MKKVPALIFFQLSNYSLLQYHKSSSFGWAAFKKLRYAIASEYCRDLGLFKKMISLTGKIFMSSLDSACVGEYSIWESRMVDEAHHSRIEVGLFTNIFECAQQVLTNFAGAYMATMQKYPEPDSLTTLKCFAVTEKLTGFENKLVSDPEFVSCFLKG